MIDFKLNSYCKSILKMAGRDDLIDNSDPLYIIEELEKDDKSRPTHSGMRGIPSLPYLASFIDEVERMFKSEDVKEAELFRDILLSCGNEVDEVFSEIRKQTPLSFYVAEICSGAYVNSVTDKITDIPDRFVGFWRMNHPRDLRYVSFTDSLTEDEWIKTKKVVSESWE